MAQDAKRPVKPSVSILDPAFRYRPSHATDVSETIARARRHLEQARSASTDDKVVRLGRPEPR